MAIPTLRNYVGGKWVGSAARESLDVRNPSTGAVIAKVPLSPPAEADDAVAAAAEAFPAWAATPVAKRCEAILRLAVALRDNEDAVARTLVEEMGKSLPDARAEMKRAIENCQVAAGMPVLQQGEKLVGVSAGIDGEVVRLPLGVFAMIAPFNFPAMVPFWFLPYAIAAGNTYVLKPSEQVPCTMQAIAALIDRAGVPAGVFNMVNGDKAVANALMDSPQVKGVSMVGSTAVCRIVAEKCAKANRRFQAMGSAKNHLVVMPDANMEQVVRNMITSCFGCAGQRCMAASAIVCVGERTHAQVVERFVAAAGRVPVADPLDPAYADEGVLIGPVISAAARERILALIADGLDEGATLALDGRRVVVEGRESGHFIGPTVFVDVRPGMKIHRTEIFGPVVVILKADSLDEAIAIINAHEYGNGASIYTRSGHYARRFKIETECGMIGVNVGIPAPASYLPFGGMKASLFADVKTQARAAVRFFTEEKIITERYWPED